MNYDMTLLHKLYCEFKDESCGSGHCFCKNEYYIYRCIPALCFVRWLVKTGKSTVQDAEIQQEILEDKEKEN